MHEMKRTAGISGDSDGRERSTMEGAGQRTAIADLSDSSTRLLKSLPQGKEV